MAHDDVEEHAANAPAFAGARREWLLTLPQCFLPAQTFW
jgi:hypothetical protein